MAAQPTKGTTMAEEENVITGHVELQEADLRSAILEASAMFRRRWWYVVAAGALLLGGPATGRGLPPLRSMAPSLAGCAAFLALLFIAPRLSARRALNALTKAGDANVYYRFDPEGVTIRAPGSTAAFAYRTVNRVREGKQTLLLYGLGGVANMVPKRAFAPAELARVSALLAANVEVQKSRLFPAWRLALWAIAIVASLVVFKLLQARGVR
jgi:hypothetical protein